MATTPSKKPGEPMPPHLERMRKRRRDNLDAVKKRSSARGPETTKKRAEVPR